MLESIVFFIPTPCSLIIYLKGWKNSERQQSNYMREMFTGVDLLLLKHLWRFAAIDRKGYDEGFLIKKALSLEFLKYRFKTHNAIFHMSLNCSAGKRGGGGGVVVLLYKHTFIHSSPSFLPGGEGRRWANELEMTMTYLACISPRSAVAEGISVGAPLVIVSSPPCLPSLHCTLTIFISSSSPAESSLINILHLPNELCQPRLSAWLAAACVSNAHHVFCVWGCARVYINISCI